MFTTNSLHDLTIADDLLEVFWKDLARETNELAMGSLIAAIQNSDHFPCQVDFQI